MNYYDQIEKYCEGQLTASEMKAFEHAMSEDMALSNEVKQYQDGMKLSEGLLEMDIMETIRKLEVGGENTVDSGQLAGQPVIVKGEPSKGQQIRIDAPPSGGWDLPASGTKAGIAEPKNNIFSIKRLLVAASLVGVMVLAWWMMKPSIMDTEQLYAKHYEAPIWPTERSSRSDLLSLAANAYLGGDFEGAKYILLDSLDDKNLGGFWLAEMYLKDGQVDSALLYLPSTTDLPSEQERILFLKAMIYLKKGDLEKANFDFAQ